MADRKSKKQKSLSAAELVDTKLIRLLIERNRHPKEAPSGRVTISLTSSASPVKEDEQLLLCESTIVVRGESEETEETAFTAECTLEGIFKVPESFKPGDKIAPDSVLLMANYLNPSVAETLEIQLFRTGFGAISLPRHFELDTVVIQ